MSPLEIKTYLNLNDANDPKNGNIELSLNQTAMNPFWCAGKVKTLAPITILSSKGRVGFTVTRESIGIFIITFNQPHPEGKDYVIYTTSEAADAYIRSTIEPTVNGFHYILKNGNTFVDAIFFFSVLA